LVLDVASGKGVSAMFFAKRFGCEVIGIDLSRVMIQKATKLVKAKGLSERVVFEVGDAEMLPFKTQMFDAVTCECALCLFPDKKSALSEMYRVLKAGGKLAITDVTLDRTPSELRNELSFCSCLAGAESRDALRSLMEDEGFVEVTAIDTSHIIVDLYERLKRHLSLLKPLLKIVRASCECVALNNIEEFGRAIEQLILEGKLGYGILIGEKPPLVS